MGNGIPIVVGLGSSRRSIVTSIGMRPSIGETTGAQSGLMHYLYLE